MDKKQNGTKQNSKITKACQKSTCNLLKAILAK